MKKSISLMALLVCASVFVVISCNKTSNNISNPTTSGQKLNTSSLAMEIAGKLGLKVQLHRNNGTKKSGVAAGQANCFGLCHPRPVAEVEGSALVSGTVIIEGTGPGTAKLYILAQPDEDVAVDPTFYVDNDIVVVDEYDTDLFTISSDAYPYNGSAGTVSFGTYSYSYYGTVDVNIQ